MENAVPQTRVLFVDDEESIRLTLPPMLESFGFSVTSAATVADALRLLTQETFDVLIADLNVGSPGDGFTVVSAMRRMQPEAVNFILTGFPAFETALQAIRQQVDDYLTKPTDIDSLVEAIREKLADRRPPRGLQPRRLAEIIEQNQNWICERWLAEVKKDPELRQISVPDPGRVDHVPRLLRNATEHMEDQSRPLADTQAAMEHGVARFQQGYTVQLVVREAKLLLRVVADCVQQNLLAIQVSNLIPDMVNVWEAIQSELEVSVGAFLKAQSARNKGEQSNPARAGRKKRRASG
jgi:ActR/RegA family two-component response regulator